MIDHVKAFSRPLGVAHKLSGRVLTEAEIRAKRVVLTGDSSVLNSENGRWLLLDSLRLLLRIAGNLTVLLPAGTTHLESEIESIASATSLWCKVDILRAPNEIAVHAADAILNVGFSGNPELPWICVNSNGWIVRAASTGAELPSQVSQPNPIAALCAASIGVAEIFKRIIGIPRTIAPALDAFEFSLFNYSFHFESPGPRLENALNLPNTLIAGGGAIGNGIGLLLSQLPLHGRVHIIDKQPYDDENYGTCVLVCDKGWVGEDKAPRLGAWLNSNSALTVSGQRILIHEALSEQLLNRLSPELIINGLDNIDARHEAQLAWPALMLDGGISDIGFAVVQHRLDDRGLACLRCTFEAQQVDHRIQQRAWTGLSLTSLSHADRRLTDDDIARAAPDKRAWLKDQRSCGRTICSMINEARLATLGVNVEEGFRPSVPFVATASAALVAAELIKALIFPQRAYSQTFTVGNIFLGFGSARTLQRMAAPTCECVTHRGLIERLRANRVATHCRA